jgi:aminoglycoside phosphotransferase (APT) family kinase protein
MVGPLAVIRAREALEAAGLGDEPAKPSGHPVRMTNALNEVWRCGPYIVRVNPRAGDTRLQREDSLLRALPVEVCAPQPVAAGSAPWGEWMVTLHLPGQELSRAWADLETSERRRAVTELAEALRALHETPAVAGIPEPEGSPHPLPAARLFPLVMEASHLPGVDPGILRSAAQRLGDVAPVLDQHPTTLVHGDLHFENVLTTEGGALSGVLDFEWAAAGPPDLDLDVLLHSLAEPALHVEGGTGGELHRRDFDEVVGWLHDAYFELFAHPRLPDRLWAYRLSYEIHALLADPPGSGPVAPHDPYARLVRLVEDRSDLHWFLDQ